MKDRKASPSTTTYETSSLWVSRPKHLEEGSESDIVAQKDRSLMRARPRDSQLDSKCFANSAAGDSKNLLPQQQIPGGGGHYQVVARNIPDDQSSSSCPSDDENTCLTVSMDLPLGGGGGAHRTPTSEGGYDADVDSPAPKALPVISRKVAEERQIIPPAHKGQVPFPPADSGANKFSNVKKTK